MLIISFHRKSYKQATNALMQL